MDFRVSVEPASPVMQNFRAEFPRSYYEKEYGKKLRTAATQVALKGFRPGKAPLNIVEKNYGQQIRADVLDDFFKTAYEKVVAEKNLEVVGVGGVHFHDGCDHHSHSEGKEDKDHVHTDDIVITAEISLMPKPEIKKWQNLKYEVAVVTPSETMVDEALEQVRQSTAKVTPIEDRDTVKKGDLVTISYELKVDGKALPARSGKDRHWETNVLGDKKFEKEIEASLEGLKVGEEKTIEFTRPIKADEKPEEEGEEKGEAKKTKREVEYQIRVEKIATKELLPISDELAKESGFAESLEDMKTQLREALHGRVKKENENRHTTAILKELVNNNSFECPQVMIDDEIRQMMFEYRVLDPNKRESYRIDVTPFRKDLGGEAEFRVRRSIILQQIASQEKIDPSKDEVEKWLDSQAEEQGVERGQVNSFYSYPEQIDRVKTIVSFQNALKLVRESAKAKETELKPDAESEAAAG